MLVYSLVLVISALKRSRAEDRIGPPLISAFSNQRIIYYNARNPVILPCSASGGNIRFNWEKDKIDVNRFKNIYKLEGGNLTVNTSNDCDGNYTCFATNDYGSTFSDKVELRKSLLKIETTKFVPVYTKIGSSLILNCNYKSNSPSTVKWAKDKTWILPNERILMDFNGNLYITRVDIKDRGNYECVIKNEGGLKINGNKYSVVLSVGIENPSTTLLWAASSPSDEVGYYSENMVLKCIFSGKNASVKWKTTSTGRELKAIQKSELLIKNLTNEDSGNYTCSSTGAKASRTFKIKILSRPKWVREPRNVEIHMGSNANFTCEATGNPRPKIDWFINTCQVKPDDLKMKEISITNNGNTLSVQNVNKQHMMSLQCRCDNGHGYVFADMYLFVSATIPTINTTPYRSSVLPSAPSTASSLISIVETTVTKKTFMTTERQTTDTSLSWTKEYGVATEANVSLKNVAAISGVLGGLIVLLVIVGTILIWRYRKNIRAPVVSSAFSNSAYQQPNETIPTCSDDTAAYETIPSRNRDTCDTYETLHAKHSSNIYSEVLDEKLNHKMCDDNKHRKATDEDINLHSCMQNSHDEPTKHFSQQKKAINTVDNHLNAVNEGNESGIDGENSFVLDTNDPNISKEIDIGRLGTEESPQTTVPEENYFVLDNTGVVPVNDSRYDNSDEKPKAVEENYFIIENSSPNDFAEFKNGTIGMDKDTGIECGEENYFVLDKTVGTS